MLSVNWELVRQAIMVAEWNYSPAECERDLQPCVSKKKLECGHELLRDTMTINVKHRIVSFSHYDIN